MWLQVDVSGGGWAPCDTPVVIGDGYVAAGALDGSGGVVGNAVALLPTLLVALSLREVAKELGHRLGVDDSDYDSDVEMGSSPLVARAARRTGDRGDRAARRGVESVVLFPVAPATPMAGESPVRGGTVPDSVDGRDSDSIFGGDLDGVGGFEARDPACGGGSRDGGCVCSCEVELVHLSRKVWKLDELVHLLVVSAGLAGWEET